MSLPSHSRSSSSSTLHPPHNRTQGRVVARVAEFDPLNLPSPLEDYQHASLLSLTLKNFLTYTHLTLHPGPTMNMIIGPNGSGKSTIVAALCLGMGWSPSVLGRSKDVGEFVRYGCEEACIEIVLRDDRELENASDDQHPANGSDTESSLDDPRTREESFPGTRDSSSRGWITIKRKIILKKKGGITSEWSINHSPSTLKTIQHMLHTKFKRQIDNLCQFLPQDKVGEFSRLNSRQLFDCTLKALDENGLWRQWHWLIERGRGVREGREQVQGMQGALFNLQQENDQVEKLIEETTQTKQARQQLKLMQAKRPWLLYDQARTAYLRSKRARDKECESLDAQIQATLTPLLALLDKKQAELQELDGRQAACNQNIANIRQFLATATDATNASKECTEARTRLLHYDALVAKSKERCLVLQAELEDLQSALSTHTLPPLAPTPAQTQAITKILSQKRNIQSEATTIDQSKMAISQKGNQLANEINAAQKKIAQLRDVDARMLERLGNSGNGDIVRLYNHLQTLQQPKGNQHSGSSNSSPFKEHVYGPICMHIAIKDTKYVAQIESLLPTTVLYQFIVTCHEDRKTLSALLQQRGWKVNFLYLEPSAVAFMRDLNVNADPTNHGDNTAKHGRRRGPNNEASGKDAVLRGRAPPEFEGGTLLDLIEGPLPVLAALVESQKIHLTPVTNKHSNDLNVDHLAKAHANLRKFASKEGVVECKRSHHSSEIIIKYSVHKGRRFLKCSAGGPSSTEDGDHEIAHLQETISKHNQAREDLNLQMKSLINQESQVSQQLESLEARKEAINAQARRYQEALNERNRIQQTIQMATHKLERERERTNESGEGERKRDKMVSELKRLIRKQASLFTDLLPRFHEYRRALMESSKLELMTLIVKREESTITHALALTNQRLQPQRDDLTDLESQLLDLKKTVKQHKNTINALTVGEAERRAFGTITDDLAALDRECTLLHARLEYNSAPTVSEAMLVAHQARKEEIQRLGAQIAATTASLNNTIAQVEAVRIGWSDAVNDLVDAINERFKANFERVQCQGYIELYTPLPSDGATNNSTYNDNNSSSGGPSYAFEDYAILIMVSFRSESPPAQLTHQRQSGGERALSTILYLLSLGPSTLWLVDEINQGMDAWFERKVHELIVDRGGADGRGGEGGVCGQCFLITPKLLSDLAYDDRMTVLAIMNAH